jgi:hypothetical protein
MTPTPTQHSTTWIAFSYVAFAATLGAVLIGIVLMPVDLALRAFMAMGTLALVQSCITLTKTLRDVHEGSKLAHRLDKARTEALLKEVGRG